MVFRLSWLLSIFIYLSVNGNLFAVPVHLCQSMAANFITSLSSTDTLKVHDHHDMVKQNKMSDNHHVMTQDSKVNVELSNSHHQNAMKSCSCTGCDCNTDIVSQVVTLFVSNVELSVFIPNNSTTISLSEQNFISQPYSNPLRPPIFS